MRMGTDPVVVVGGGPSGLIAAETLAAAGRPVIVVDHMPSLGRKFLLAGRGGLNLTHSEPLDDMLGRYRPPDARLVSAITRFSPTELRAWSASLGQPTFVGSSGRVFPDSFRATPLLRAWLARLHSLGVVTMVRHRLVGLDPVSGTDHGVNVSLAAVSTAVGADGHAGSPPNGLHRIRAAAVVLALGGASWPRVGSDGTWTGLLGEANLGIGITPLTADNVGYRVGWSQVLTARFAGVPLKNVVISVAGRSVRGEAMVTSAGIEGGAIYTIGGAIRNEFAGTGTVTISIDLHPDLTVDEVRLRLVGRRAKDSMSTALRRQLGLSPLAVALLREATGNRLPSGPATLASLIKDLPIRLDGPMPIGRAISTAGGVKFTEIDDAFMLHRLPGVFVAGEMLEWSAPTGGYLLQASFSTGVAAARGALAWLEADRAGRDGYEEITDGDTVWRFERRFLMSNWICIWGRGCQGILPERAEHLGHGCCSIGAELDGDDEAMNVAALAAALSPALFQHHAEAVQGGVFRDDSRTSTRVVDGACIFFNRPGFGGGAGCALHLAALDSGESPTDWKPSVCWQLPIKVDWEDHGTVEVATVRGWTRADWGAEGKTMAWCCTEEPEAYVGDGPVVESLGEEIALIVGEAVAVELRRRLAPG